MGSSGITASTLIAASAALYGHACWSAPVTPERSVQSAWFGGAEPPAKQPAPPGEPEPAPPPASDAKPGEAPKAETPPALPDLDELLGTGEKSPDGGAPTPDQTDLNDLLSAGDLGDAFEQTVGIMKQAASRLKPGEASVKPDAGLTTQRLQEDAVRRLDLLIASLQAMQKQSSSSQSQSSDSQGQQPNQQSQTRGTKNNQGENNGQVSPPPMQEGALRPGLESARAAWGALPQRVREMLMQGSGDHFSKLYESMTEAYYQRLAEQKRNP